MTHEAKGADPMTPRPQTPPVGLPDHARVLASGLGFTEGPVVLDEHTIAVTSVNRGVVYRLRLDGGQPETLVECGGGPNGAAVGRDGLLHITQNGGTAMPSRSALDVVPSIQTYASGRLATPVTSGVDAPSDCVVGPDDRLWFTDPADHVLDGPGLPGRVHAWDPASGRLTMVIEGLAFPNGIAFGADPGELYVAETAGRRVRRYRVEGDTVTADGWTVTLPGGHPDGMAIDAAGWLWVAGSTGHNIMAFDRSGALRHEIDLGKGVFVTSLCFAGSDWEQLVVTSPKGGTVLVLRPPHPGLPLPVWRRPSLEGTQS
jgi:gluconolactonase